MKFISKSSNLLIVLRAGLQAQPITGTPARPTVSVRFKDGVAEVQEEELVKLMLAHPGFNGDFISADIDPVDPYAASRQSSEPAHVLTDLKFGTPIARKIEGGGSQMSPELQKMIQSAAAEMAKQMIPGMIKDILVAHEASKKTEVKTKGKPGRKPKNKVEEKVVESAPIGNENPLMQGEAS